MNAQNSWKQLSSRVVYTNPWISIREDTVIRLDGKEGIEQPRYVSFSEFWKLVHSGEINECQSIAAVSMAERIL